MKLFAWLRRTFTPRKIAEDAASIVAKVAVDEIAKATGTKGQWQ